MSAGMEVANERREGCLAVEACSVFDVVQMAASQ